MLKLGTIVMGAQDVERGVAFWAAVLGYDPVPFESETDGFTMLVPPGGVGTRLAMHRSSVPVQEEPRIHVDLVVDTAEEQAAEVERMVDLGATRVDWTYPPDPDFVVLADTEGNRFCIVDASHG